MVYSQGNSGSHYNKEGGNRGSNNNFHANAPAPPININIELYEGNDKSKIRLDLFDTQAEKHAKGIIDERKNKINQIRIFYNQFIVLNEKINNSEDGQCLKKRSENQNEPVVIKRFFIKMVKIFLG